MQAEREYEKVQGEFQHVIYSPHGTIEGAMVASGNEGIQLIVSDDGAGNVFRHVAPGAVIGATVEFIGWSSSKAGGHRVYQVDSIQSVDGKRPTAGKAPKRKAAYSGQVVRLNYARHGEPNGVVLDSGDFIHLKPEGFKKLKLKIGDTIEVDGDSHPLDAEQGYVVEAMRVNGKSIA